MDIQNVSLNTNINNSHPNDSVSLFSYERKIKINDIYDRYEMEIMA